MRVEITERNTERLRDLSNKLQISANSINNFMLEMLFMNLTAEQLEDSIRNMVHLAILKTDDTASMN